MAVILRPENDFDWFGVARSSADVVGVRNVTTRDANRHYIFNHA